MLLSLSSFPPYRTAVELFWYEFQFSLDTVELTRSRIQSTTFLTIARLTHSRHLEINKVISTFSKLVCSPLTIDVGTISNELYQMTNLALLCEDVVNGMIAADKFRGNVDPSLPISITSSQVGQQQNQSQEKRLEIILDIEHRDWDYDVQPGMSLKGIQVLR